MEKRNLAIIVLAVALVASGIGNVLLLIPSFEAPTEVTTLSYATSSGPRDLDPVNSWDSASNDVIEQVAEGLFSYDYADPTLPRVNRLAEGYHWVDNTTLEIQVREGVLFHDGTRFDADAAKWNLDRINFLINATGDLPATVPKAQTESLWLLPNGDPIIDNVVSDGNYNITINMNGVFSPFLDLLCYANAYMLSPDSTPAEKYIDTVSGDLVGTGPYVYDSYKPDVEVRFHRNEKYWQGPAGFEVLVFAIIEDATTRTNAFLNGEVDLAAGLLTSMYPTFKASSDFNFVEVTEETGLAGLVYQYLGFNNEKINVTMRKAMAYAFNYTYMLEEMLQDQAIRAYSPISPGWGDDWYNDSVDFPNYNLTEARRILVDSGVASGLPINGNPDDSQWLAADIATYSYQGNTGNSFREDMLTALQDWYEPIGITVTDDLMTWGEYLELLFYNYDDLELFFIGWLPDYLNPWNMMDPLFNPASYSNSGQVNDTALTQALNDIVAELNETKAQEMVKDLQYYFAKNQFHLYAYHSKIIGIYPTYIKGLTLDAMGTLDLYGVYREEW